ncbi:aldo/keto reductase [Sorangium sp. So ce726]
MSIPCPCARLLRLLLRASRGRGATLPVSSRGVSSPAASRRGRRPPRPPPRFTGENREKNEDAVVALRRVAEERVMTAGQLAIAWALARQPAFVPVIGAKTPAQLDDALAALDRPLSRDDLAPLEALAAISDDRHGAEPMRQLDSGQRAAVSPSSAAQA